MASRPKRKASAHRKTAAPPKRQGRPPRDRRAVDVEWIQARLAAVGRTQRELAAAWGASPATVTRVLKNNRRLTLDEFAILCDVLERPAADLLPRLGYFPKSEHATLELSGAVNTKGQVTSVTADAGRTVPAPNVPHDDIKALVVRAKSGRLAPWDGCLVYYQETSRRRGVPAFDRLAVVEVEGEVVPLLGMRKRCGCNGSASTTLSRSAGLSIRTLCTVW